MSPPASTIWQRSISAKSAFRRRCRSSRELLPSAHFGYDHPSVAIPLGNLATFYRAGGLTSVAEPLARKTLVMIIKDAGAQHPMTAQCLNNLATILMDQQRFEEAESLFRRALTIQQQALGADHPVTKRDAGKS